MGRPPGGHDLLSEIVRKVLLTYWNTASFLVLYANAGGWTAADGLASAPAAAQRPVLDRWVLGELHAVVRDVTAWLEGFDTAAAGGGSRRSSMTCPTGTCGGPGGGSGTGPGRRTARRRSPPCMSA